MDILSRTPEIILSPKIGVSFKGRYKAMVVEGHGASERIVREFPWADNLVLDSGRDFFFTNALTIAYAAKGTDNTAPNVAQTALGAQVGSRSSDNVGSDVVTSDATTATATITRTIDFADEVSPQNYNEAGWAPSSTGSLFSRVVFASTVTVLAGQRLRLQYAVTSTISPTIVTASTPTITGWTGAGDMRLKDFAGLTESQVGLGNQLGRTAVGAAYSAITFNTWPAAATTSTAGLTTGGASGSAAAYTPGSFQRDLTLVWDVGSNTGTWAGFSFGYASPGSTAWIHKFTTPQVKASTHRVTINYRVALL
jgi:hypothetical protein